VAGTPGLVWPEKVPVEVRLAARASVEGAPAIAVVFVPYDAGRANPNRLGGKHWSRRHSEADPAQLAAMWGYREAGDPTNDRPVTVELVSFRERSLDDDNLLAGLKAVRDYLFGKVRAGGTLESLKGSRMVPGRLAPDDSREWVEYRLPVRMVTGPQWKGPKAWTVFIVRLREE